MAKSSYEDLNTTLGLSAPPDLNSYKFEDIVALVVENNSKTVIKVAPDEDLKIFKWEENLWNEVKNGVDYLAAVDRLTSETNDDPGGTIYTVAINVPEQHDPVRLCITLEGINDPDGLRTKVAAYIDVILNP